MAIIPGEDDNLFCGTTTPTDPTLQLVNPRMANAACIALVWLLRTALTLAPTISGSTAPGPRLSELTPVTSLSPATDLDQAVSYDVVAPYGGEIDVSLPFLRTSTKHSLRLHLPFQHGGFQVGLSFTGTRGRKAAPNSVTLHWRYPELLRPGSWLKPKCDDEPPENHAHQGQPLVNNSDRGSIPLVTFQARKGKPTFLSLNRSLADLMKLARPGMTGRSGLPSGLLFNSPLPTGPAVHVQI
ncbi:hypothetical protein IWQ60_001487 [Tieghemiomyces parasiticus]|uniref:Uncharacterized protein n=1 Tax=Tieghemiomyces parasiticus TaxID=78921 RepID=A0A9W8AGM2_9FUNG|nr:hypothetical protein IWQ60_001487 [Tieghemiomyces parasiticus]